MREKQLTAKEIKEIQLEMLDEIDAFCRNHHIRYSLAFGTLLGAVRHKGYIPWDDDVDIIMPYPDMIRFKKEFKSEKLAYIDIDTKPYYEFQFSRISYLPTYSKPGFLSKSYGVNIDLYPVVGMADTEEDIQAFLTRIAPLNKKRIQLIKWRNRLVRLFPWVYIPQFTQTMRRFHDEVLYSYPYKTAKNYLHAGSVRRVNIFNFDVFETLVDIEFEGHRLMALGRHHEYLTQCYGDYMQLPPEEERIPYHQWRFYRK